MSTHRPVLVLSFALPVLGACAETCPLPQDELNGKVFAVSSRVLTTDQEPDPAWPMHTSPVNGDHVWTITWTTPDYASPVVVTLDDQEFQGEGNFNDVECGNFSVGFSGDYAGEDGSLHRIALVSRLVIWPEHLDGFVEFQSTWESATGAAGSADGTAQIAGTSP